jgi:hypothetical protein
MKKIFIIFILVLKLSFSFGQELKKQYQDVISKFIDCIKTQNKEKLSSLILYPLKREYPIPDIKNKQEFLKKYNEIFDDSLIQKIVKSNLTKDWCEMGWRGLMFLNGDIWISTNGNLIALNYQSKFEKSKLIELIDADKLCLNESIRKFERAECLLETSKYRIRIDNLGNDIYRYTSWLINSKMSEKPNLIVVNGEFVFDGSGGNGSYVFKNGDYIYECSIIIMGEKDSPPAYLTISKDGKVIFYQKAKIIRN